MAYINIDIDDRTHERKATALLQAERKFWEELALELQLKLENIPRAVREHGYVQIHDGAETMTLVIEPEDAPQRVKGDA